MIQPDFPSSDLKKERIMASVFDETAVGICITDASGRFVQVNRAYCQIYGYSSDELIGQPFTLVVPPGYQNQAQTMHDAFIGGQPEIPVEWVVQRKDGTHITIVVTAALMTDEDGEKYKITTVTDITHQKKAEQLINRFGRILSQSYDEIFIFDATSLRILQANQSALDNLGYSLDEIRRLTPLDIDIDPDGNSLETSLKELRSQNQDFCRFETVQRRKDGSTYQVEVRLQFMHHENPPVFVAIVQDISQRKKLDRIQRELFTAGEIQKGLMPRRQPDVPGYSVFGLSNPSKQVGGDYFDFQSMGDGKLAFCLGDVAGKGMPAALLMCNLQAIIRGQTLSNANPSECLEATNTLVYYNTPADRFVSLFFGILDPTRHTITFANAGHQPPMLFRPDRSLQHLPIGNLVLGVKRDVAYDTQELVLQPGETLVLFSDGIVEATAADGTFFDDDRLIDAVTQKLDRATDEIASAVLARVDAFLQGQPPQDDLTLLLIQKT